MTAFHYADLDRLEGLLVALNERLARYERRLAGRGRPARRLAVVPDDEQRAEWDDDPLRCPVCLHRFPDVEGLRRHVRTHLPVMRPAPIPVRARHG